MLEKEHCFVDCNNVICREKLDAKKKKKKEFGRNDAKKRNAKQGDLESNRSIFEIKNDTLILSDLC